MISITRKRKIEGHIIVVSATHCSGGEPTFVVHAIEASDDDIENGEHYDAALDMLENDGYNGPHFHFDEDECPDWLMAQAWKMHGIVEAADLLD